MKKTLVALAIAGAFTGAAYAQSSVTIYGIADIGYQYVDPDRGGPAAATGISGGIRNGNRLGFRGSEDLGGGQRAIFQLETGFNPDVGTLGQGGRIFGRQAYAGVQGNWGTLVAGRMATYGSGTGAFDMISDIDPFYTGFTFAGMQATMSEANSLRVDNAINYRTPNISGFQAGYMHSFATGPSNSTPINQEVPGVSNNLRVDSFGVSYGAGPFYAAATYMRAEFPKVAPPGVTPEDQKIWQIGATWDFKVVKLHGMYADEQNVRSALIQPAGFSAANGEGTDAKSWMLGASIPFGPLASHFMLSYQNRDGKNEKIGTATWNADRKVWGIGYEYMLSRRTYLHTFYADSSGSNTLAKSSSNVNTALPTDFANARMISVGMTHFF